ncbi:uncharacterized protein LOC133174218 [Saccostrea echinata]|uniref:uncharacterized protein LOC133174218 n=1 Tax=Saccostrea echinata TaxID=191078 RepID=UPI002A81BB0E|nr:uncharacterized protein LOC133174218 [Saccostrea echinata]
MYLFLFSVYFLSVITATVAEYCTASSNLFYCEYGCCGNSCCPNEVAIGVGTTFGGIVLLIIAGGVFICCIQRRYNPKEAVKFTKDAQTQWEKAPVGINRQATADNNPKKRRSTVAPLPPPTFALRQQTKIEEVEEQSENTGNNQQNQPIDNPV